MANVEYIDAVNAVLADGNTIGAICPRIES
jgi:hypothetical protein